MSINDIFRIGQRWRLKPISESKILKWILARPLIKELRYFQPRIHRRLLQALGLGITLGMVAGVMISPAVISYIRRIHESYKLRQQQNAFLKPFIDEAKKLNMTYEHWQVGKPVYWYIYHPGYGLSQLKGKGDQPIEWTNENMVPLSAQRRPDWMVAIVQGKSPNGSISLTFIGE